MGVNELVCGSSKLKEKMDGDRSAKRTKIN
jgi:hypothetical protein